MQNPADDYKVFIQRAPQPREKTAAQKRAIIIAHIERIFFVLGCIGLIYVLFVVFSTPLKKFEHEFGVDQDSLIVTFIVCGLISFVLLGICGYLVRILYQGSQKREFVKINRWFFVNTIFFILSVVVEIPSMKGGTMTSIIPSALALLYRAISLLVIWDFRSELKIEMSANNGIIYSQPEATNPNYYSTEQPPPYYPTTTTTTANNA